MITSSSVNPTLLRPVLGTAGHRLSAVEDGAAGVMGAVWSSRSQLFPSGGSYSVCKTTQECATHTPRSVTLLS